MKPAVAFLVVCVFPGPAAGAPQGIEEAEAAIERLAALHDGSASPRSLQAAAELREVLMRVGASALAGGKESRAAWSLLEATLKRRQRDAAMEAVFLLAGMKGPRGLACIFRCAGSMDPAVARQAFRLLLAQGRDIRGARAESLAALRGVRDPEAAAAVAGLVASLHTLEACRALLAASPAPPAATDRKRRRDDARPVREAIVEGLASQTAPEASRWLSGPAFAESRKEAHRAPGRLWVAARAAARRRDARARRSLEELVFFPDERVAKAALDAISTIGPAPSRGALEKAVCGNDVRPCTAADAGILLGRVDRDAAAKALVTLSGRSGWRFRAEAARALACLPASDAAFRRCLRLTRDPNREVRASAYKALRSFPRKEAVAEVLRRLKPLQSPDRALAVRYLEWASGKRLGKDRDAWRSWWRSAEATFRFPLPRPVSSPRPSRSSPRRREDYRNRERTDAPSSGS